jgi:hypothetical protein
MQYIVFGANSSLGKEIAQRKEPLYSFDRNWTGFKSFGDEINENIEFLNDLKKSERYVVFYFSSVLHAKSFSEQDSSERLESYNVNTIIPILLLRSLNQIPDLEFVFVYLSSESARKGSYDCSYWMTKMATQKYVEDYKLNNPKSRSLCIAPSTMDSGMTLRRHDLDRVKIIRNSLRSKRFVTPKEIIDFLIEIVSEKYPYLSNTTIEFNDGKFAIIK